MELYYIKKKEVFKEKHLSFKEASRIAKEYHVIPPDNDYDKGWCDPRSMTLMPYLAFSFANHPSILISCP
jgi:hypothetical protein